ncbi:hypothetical protein HRR83_004536 [Exophiala dermatitidis]|uniref:Uncharacterized protein n=2 Tax=Exophiala dermatitidis TaxID=5970 RepID=H6BQY1_EXODN
MSLNTTTTTTVATTKTVETMHNYGADYFENFGAMAVQYLQQKSTKSQPQSTQSTPLTTPLASPTSEVTPSMHGYGNSWFDNYDSQWQQWQKKKSATKSSI